MGKERVSTDPQNTHWSKDTGRYGYQMLEKMGWAKGKGLGKEETGVQTHVVVKKREDNVGLGADRSTHFDWRVHMTNLDSVLKGLKGNAASPKGSDSEEAESEKAKEKRERKEQRKKRKLAEREAEEAEAAAKSAGEASEGEASPRKKQKTTMLEGGIEVVAPTGRRRKDKPQSSYSLPSVDTTASDDPYATHAFQGFSS